MASMYQTTDESLNKIREDMQRANGITQRAEMERLGLQRGEELLEAILGNRPWHSLDNERSCDRSILQMNIRDARKLLETRGETDMATVLQMKQLAYLNSVIAEKYMP
jgi:hypothetical protein